MKKTIFTVLGLAVMLICFAQKPYKVVFYNFENLFDTIHEEGKHDEEFTPNGTRAWNTVKYNKKLANIDKALFGIACVDNDFPIVIGISEIENRTVLEDVLAQPKLKHGNYRIVHYESPDARGIDCAFFYRPDVFKLEGSAPVHFKMPGMPNFRTRDFVTMWGTIEGEPFYFIVNHWPSRLGGKEASSPKREAAAAQCKHLADSVMSLRPGTKVMIMGDLNDDATDKSITEVLGAKGKIKELEPGGYFNPFIEVLKAGYGTLAYGDAWNLFDNIIVSENLATGSTGKIKIQRKEGEKFYGNIFAASYMIQKEGKFKGYPLRTFSGTNFQNGFSDHFPVYVFIGK